MLNKRTLLSLCVVFVLAAVAAQTRGADAPANGLKVHGIFSSNMVIQRDKPIRVWGWAAQGKKVSVQFGRDKAEAKAEGKAGRWSATFPARGADANAVTLTVSCGDEKVDLRPGSRFFAAAHSRILRYTPSSDRLLELCLCSPGSLS